MSTEQVREHRSRRNTARRRSCKKRRRQLVLRRLRATLDACCDPITSNLYDAGQAGEVPELALKASLGCGNPTALAELKPGETVLDLGSGGGIDVLFSARRVGPAGKAYGLDMTDEMLALAEENKRKSGLENVEFLKGEIEHIPLPTTPWTSIISNCVINLSGDKDRVIERSVPRAQAGRPLRGLRRRRPRRGAAGIRKSMELWVGCVAGALGDYEYVAKLAKAGFDGIDIETTRVYSLEDARAFPDGRGARRGRAREGGRRHVHQRVHPRDETRGGSVLRAGVLQLRTR